MLHSLPRAAFAITAVFFLAAPSPVRAGTPQTAPPSSAILKPHEALWTANRHRSVPHRPWRYEPGPRKPRAMEQEHFVFGYLPYWELNYDNFQWDLLTHLGYFAVELKGTGALGDSHKFLDASTSALIAEAHAHGVAVILTATLFDNTQIGTLVNDPALRKKAIDGLVGMVVAQGADGVNIDFEFVPSSGKAGFVTFLSELSAAVKSAIPGGHVSIAGPSVDWSGSYDYDQIALACDAIFIMAYGYHWKGSDPGPLCPITKGSIWGKYTLAWTIDDYVANGGEGIRAKLVAGLPLYGYDWASTGTNVPGTKLANGTVVFYDDGLVAGSNAGWKWDPESQSSYYVYDQGGAHQVWLDTAQSLAARFDFAVEQGLGGVGFWALGYDGGDMEVWDELEQRYPPAVVDPPDPPDPDVSTGEPDAGSAPVPDAGGSAYDAGIAPTDAGGGAHGDTVDAGGAAPWPVDSGASNPPEDGAAAPDIGAPTWVDGGGKSFYVPPGSGPQAPVGAGGSSGSGSGTDTAGVTPTARTSGGSSSGCAAGSGAPALPGALLFFATVMIAWINRRGA